MSWTKVNSACDVSSYPWLRNVHPTLLFEFNLLLYFTILPYLNVSAAYLYPSQFKREITGSFQVNQLEREKRELNENVLSLQTEKKLNQQSRASHEKQISSLQVIQSAADSINWSINY